MAEGVDSVKYMTKDAVRQWLNLRGMPQAVVNAFHGKMGTA